MRLSNTNDARELRVLGVKVNPINMDDAVSTIQKWIETRSPHYVCITGVHGVMECQSDPLLHEIHEHSGMNTPDGMPLVWMAHWLGFRNTRRVYGPDLMRALTKLSECHGYRHFYYGGGEGLADHLSQVLKAKHPKLEVVGTYTPPFRALTAEEDREVVQLINDANPDIVWVGLSTPKQEYWLASHIGLLNAPVLIGVGAAFDFLAGTKPQAPVWMQRNGIEWLFRLSTEPKRLWRRYCWMIPRFMVMAAAQLIKMPIHTEQLQQKLENARQSINRI